jgi:hypothetical protein
MAEMRNEHKILFEKPEGNRPVGTPVRTWEDSIKMDLQEIGLVSVNLIHLAQDRDQLLALVNTVMNLQYHTKLVIS